MIHRDSFPLFPFKNCHGWAESSELVSGHESTFSSDCWLFWLKHLSFLLTLAFWLLAVECQAAETEFCKKLSDREKFWNINFGLFEFWFQHFIVIWYKASWFLAVNNLIFRGIQAILWQLGMTHPEYKIDTQ